MRRMVPVLAALLATLFGAAGAQAEAADMTVAEQFGLAFLPMMVMQERQLVEQHAASLGLPGLRVRWVRLSGSAAINDALLSGAVDIASGGVPGLVTLWDKTRGRLDVRGICAMESMPVLLNTRNAKVRTIADFSDEDRIAVAAVGVSAQAILLEIAAAARFGEAEYRRLDHLTVSMPQPDAMTALLSGAAGIDSHFAAPPFQYLELAHPGIHTVLNSYQVFGGPTTFNVVWTTRRFHDANPKAYQAFLDAFEEATKAIARDRDGAAAAYLRVSQDKTPRETILKILADPEIRYTTVPQNTMKYARFMHKVGRIAAAPDSWRDLFFENLHGRSGS